VSSYRIEVFPTHNEVTIDAEIRADLVGEIMAELAKTPDFPDRHAIWILSKEGMAPPFPEFTTIINLVRGYLRPDLTDKRVALVVGGALNRALIEMFRREAVSLPLELRVFTEREEALAWLHASGRERQADAP
jgi:hypothetical protein